MENAMQDKIFETLAVDENGQDVYGKVQTILLKKLVATKMQFPFMKEIDAKIREAAGNTADFFDKNEISDETQFKWLRMVEVLAQSFNSLGMVAVSYSISRTPTSNLEELKAKAVSKFNNSAFIQTVNRALAELKSLGINTNEYTQVITQSVSSVVSGVFQLNSGDLSRFTQNLNISEDSKAQILRTITEKRGLFVATGTDKTVQIPKMQKTPVAPAVTISPEIAKVIANNFSAYMAKMKEKFGNDALVAMQQALAREISKQ